MEHMQYLVVRSHNSDGQDFHHPMENPDDRDHDNLSGHALMATCPPLPHIRDTPNEPYPYQMPELNMPDLRKLLHLSARLPINHTTEITPIMAWTKIYTDPRLALLSPIDVEKMKLNLQTKTRCYGYVVGCSFSVLAASRDGWLTVRFSPLPLALALSWRSLRSVTPSKRSWRRITSKSRLGTRAPFNLTTRLSRASTSLCDPAACDDGGDGPSISPRPGHWGASSPYSA